MFPQPERNRLAVTLLPLGEKQVPSQYHKSAPGHRRDQDQLGLIGGYIVGVRVSEPIVEQQHLESAGEQADVPPEMREHSGRVGAKGGHHGHRRHRILGEVASSGYRSAKKAMHQLSTIAHGVCIEVVPPLLISHRKGLTDVQIVLSLQQCPWIVWYPMNIIIRGEQYRAHQRYAVSRNRILPSSPLAGRPPIPPKLVAQG